MRALLFLCPVIAIAALAAPVSAADRNGFQAIGAGDMAGAERSLVAERRIFPDRPELLLNLAAVYRRTGRDAEARALYVRVLARPAVQMDMASGAVVSSHDLANRALGGDARQIAAR